MMRKRDTIKVPSPLRITARCTREVKFAGPLAQGVLDPKPWFLDLFLNIPKGRFTSPYPSAGEPWSPSVAGLADSQ